MMGPMLMSAIAHLAASPTPSRPGELVAAASRDGAGIGCRFVGAALDQLTRSWAPRWAQR